MKLGGWAVLAMVAITSPFGPVNALEKRTAPIDDSLTSEWNAGAECRVSYFNICTGWIWVWDGFPHKSRLGMLVEGCCSPGCPFVHLLSVQMFIPSGLPAGRGFTGTLSTYAADASRCPTGPPLASRPYLPTSLFTIVPFSGETMPSQFVLVAETADHLGFGISESYGTDRPAAGPTGPQACGLCYAATRQTHSFMFGTVSSPLCPGSTFNDGVCDAELFWDVDAFCCDIVDVKESTWGTIKNLYR